MFIDEQTAEARLRSSQNILNRVARESPQIDPADLILPETPNFEGSEESEPAMPVDLSGLEGEPEDLTSQEALARILSPEPEYLGRRRRLTNEERASIGLMGRILTERSAAAIGGISNGHANNLTHGYTDGVARKEKRPPRADLVEMIEAGHKEIVELVFGKMELAIGIIDANTLKNVGALKASQIARNLSGIIDKAKPREVKDEGGQHAHFHIYRPEAREEDTYDTVVVNSTTESGA